jgi:hypoxia up-regulated 1
MRISISAWSTVLGLAANLFTCVSAKAILGVDIGSLYMKVALVQRGAPLEIVTNFHSKRKTEQLILFDEGTRYYGADASSLLARKPTKTPGAMSVMLGRDDEHPAVKVCRHRVLNGIV